MSSGGNGGALSPPPCGGGDARGSISAPPTILILKQPTLRRPLVVARERRLRGCRSLATRGEWSAAWRHTDLVAPCGAGVPCDRDTAPCGAPLRRSHLGVGPRFAKDGRQAVHPVSRLPAGDRLLSPGGAPTPPGCRLCESQPAGAAPAGSVSRSRHRGVGAVSPAAARDLLHLKTPHEAPLCEQGDASIREVFGAGITYFQKSYPRGHPSRLASLAPQDEGLCVASRHPGYEGAEPQPPFWSHVRDIAFW